MTSVLMSTVPSTHPLSTLRTVHTYLLRSSRGIMLVFPMLEVTYRNETVTVAALVVPPLTVLRKVVLASPPPEGDMALDWSKMNSKAAESLPIIRESWRRIRGG